MDHLEKYEEIIGVLTGAVVIDGKEYRLKDELEKFYVAGNKRAGTRIRKMMQMIKGHAQDLRIDVQDYRKKI